VTEKENRKQGALDLVEENQDTALANLLRDHPTLTREKAREMLREAGF
jgi:hypothetical protein